MKAQKAWAASLPAERAEVMRNAARVMETRHGEIVSWLIAEAGSTRIKAELEYGPGKPGAQPPQRTPAQKS